MSPQVITVTTNPVLVAPGPSADAAWAIQSNLSDPDNSRRKAMLLRMFLCLTSFIFICIPTRAQDSGKAPARAETEGHVCQSHVPAPSEPGGWGPELQIGQAGVVSHLVLYPLKGTESKVEISYHTANGKVRQELTKIPNRSAFAGPLRVRIAPPVELDERVARLRVKVTAIDPATQKEIAHQSTPPFYVCRDAARGKLAVLQRDQIEGAQIEGARKSAASRDGSTSDLVQTNFIGLEVTP